MASVDVKTLKQDRTRDRGSDETALQLRRKIQRWVREGDEIVIKDLVLQLGEYLSSTNAVEKKNLEPAAIASALGLGKLCDPSPTQIQTYPFPYLNNNTEEIRPEKLLLHTLNKGNNELQAAAAEALGYIGTQLSLDALKDRQEFDKSASVRARCKIAIRRLTQRYKSSGISKGKLLEVIKNACTGTYMEIIESPKTNAQDELIGDPKYVVTVKIQPPKEALQNVRTQRVEITICDENRELKTGVKRDLQYLSLSTICGAARENNYIKALRLNASCLSQGIKDKNTGDSRPLHDYEFTQGALAVSNDKLMLIQTIPTALVRPDSLQEAIVAIANNGDELEKVLNPGNDSH